MSTIKIVPRADGVVREVLELTDLATLSLPYATDWVQCVYHPGASLDVHGVNLANLAVNIEVANNERASGHVKATGGAGLYSIDYYSAFVRVVITAGTGKCGVVYAGTPQAG